MLIKSKQIFDVYLSVGFKVPFLGTKIEWTVNNSTYTVISQNSLPHVVVSSLQFENLVKSY